MRRKPKKSTTSAPRRRAPQPLSKTGRLEDQVVLVTGGSRGIGLAMAVALAREGASVIITGRDDRALHSVVQTIGRNGGNAVAHICDVRDEESVDDLFQAIRKHFGRLDVLVNNAGVAHASHHIDRLSVEMWQSTMDTNLTGAFLVTRAALPLMRRGSTIVNNVSVAATTPFTGMAAYNASKAGLLAFTNTLRAELRGRGIRVIALMPGATDTEIWQQFWADAPRQGMMPANSIAEALLAALCLPENTTLEQLIITPTSGSI